MEELIERHNIDPKKLKGSDTWTKRDEHSNSTSIVPEVMPPNTPADTHNSLHLTLPEGNEQMLTDIKQVKKDAIKYAKDFLRDNSKHAEVKEIKDVLAMVLSLEDSIKDKKDTGPTVNVLVQNITERFKDDC